MIYNENQQIQTIVNSFRYLFIEKFYLFSK